MITTWLPCYFPSLCINLHGQERPCVCGHHLATGEHAGGGGGGGGGDESP